MKTIIKLLAASLAAFSCITVTSTAATLVQWGALSGEEIVSDNTAGQNTFGTTYDTQEVNPSPGSNGYYITSPSERSSVFHGAQAQAFGGAVFVNPGSADYMQMVANSAAAYEGMAAWDSFLLGGGLSLDSYSIEFQRRGAAGADISFLLETSSGWYVTDTVGSADGANWTTFSLNVSSETWSSFSSFGVTGGGGAPDLNDIQSVGFRVESGTGGTWDGARVRYFQANATIIPTPEPSSLGLLFLGAGLLRNLRKRKIS